VGRGDTGLASVLTWLILEISLQSLSIATVNSNWTLAARPLLSEICRFVFRRLQLCATLKGRDRSIGNKQQIKGKL
jgi:hypothetical protein